MINNDFTVYGSYNGLVRLQSVRSTQPFNE
jgi:hypothetical protein